MLNSTDSHSEERKTHSKSDHLEITTGNIFIKDSINHFENKNCG